MPGLSLPLAVVRSRRYRAQGKPVRQEGQLAAAFQAAHILKEQRMAADVALEGFHAKSSNAKAATAGTGRGPRDACLHPAAWGGGGRFTDAPSPGSGPTSRPLYFARWTPP